MHDQAASELERSLTLEGRARADIALYSPLSTTLTVPNIAKGAGEIFRTDFTGDGTTQDPVPRSHVVEFDRGINASNINRSHRQLQSYSRRQAYRAGQVLVQEGLMTSGQLTALGALGPELPDAPVNQAKAIRPASAAAIAAEIWA